MYIGYIFYYQHFIYDCFNFIFSIQVCHYSLTYNIKPEQLIICGIRTFRQEKIQVGIDKNLCNNKLFFYRPQYRVPSVHKSARFHQYNPIHIYPKHSPKLQLHLSPTGYHQHPAPLDPNYSMQELINDFYMFQFNEAKSQAQRLEEVARKEAREAKKRLCEVCDDKKEDFYSLEKCSHSICADCNREYLKAKVQEGCRLLENFCCPYQDRCGALYSETELEKLMDFEYFAKLTNRVIFELDIVCPGCRIRCSFKSNEEAFVCEHCYIGICKFCKSFEHAEKCNTATGYFKEVMAAINENDEEIGYCPECKTPFLKDENCDHVTCQNENCSLEFCFYCSAPFHGINWHSNQYHRQDCRNYESCDYQDYFTHDCPACAQKYDKTCTEEVCDKPTMTREEFLDTLKKEAMGVSEC